MHVEGWMQSMLVSSFRTVLEEGCMVEGTDVSHGLLDSFAVAAVMLDIYALQSAQPSHLPTLLKGLDAALRGGMPCGSITEVVGAAGAGKTQLCLLLTISAVLHGHVWGGRGGSVLYIDAERKFSSTRMVEMARKRFPDLFTAALQSENQRRLLENVLVITPHSAADMLDRLQALESSMIDQQVRLIVVDSIAVLARATGTTRDEMMEQQSLLARQVSLLKYYAHSCALPVLITNQVTAAVGGPAAHGFEDEVHRGAAEGGTGASTSDGGGLTAALGAMWAHAVNVRLVMEVGAYGRTLKIGKSPLCPNITFRYITGGDGIQLTGEEEEGGPMQPGSVIGSRMSHDINYQPQQT